MVFVAGSTATAGWGWPPMGTAVAARPHPAWSVALQVLPLMTDSWFELA